MKAEILCVGTELLLGDIVNTNAAYLARELAAMGINVYHQTVVGDNPGRLKEALGEAFGRAELVIMTGGLGPTYDDLTKETVAGYFGREMELNQPSLISDIPPSENGAFFLLHRKKILPIHQYRAGSRNV